MKQKKVIKIKTKFSNRLLYTFITLGILIISIAGVYAWSASGAGHNSDEIDFSTGTSNAIFSTYQGTDPGSYAQTQINKWGLSSAGTMFLEPAAGSILWLTDSWGGTGSVKVVANQFTVGPSSTDSNKVILTKGGDITATGSISAGSFLYSSSDERLKTNIQSLQNSLTKVQQLKGVSFNWKANGQESLGLIAQDVEKVFPQIVGTDKEGMKSVDYTKLVAVLIEAMKEQQKQIDELKSRCN
ncbi:MAG: tail fiber domain-containing protein [Nanoarchaeota archaeon]